MLLLPVSAGTGRLRGPMYQPRHCCGTRALCSRHRSRPAPARPIMLAPSHPAAMLARWSPGVHATSPSSRGEDPSF
eukprot:1638866-Rhodomonas_salina.1